MSNNWITVPAGDVEIGDRVRVRGRELEVTRVDDPFLGREGMVCFVQSTSEGWDCAPTTATGEVEVLR